ncbi:MAG: hypothetical protein IJW05_04920 [Lentisphaeria bacterium]|nr:hypothetical protein [Lentisphaeria bacterium]
MDKSMIFDRVKIAVDYMVKHQVINRLDANQGRTLNYYNSVSGLEYYTTSWETGAFMACLLAMYKRTGDPMYLDRAEHAGHYIMSLQVLDQRNPKYYGAFHECTPQSVEFCPRDATTAAWCMVWLYEATKKAEYLDRAILFAEWHLKYGMCGGWPLWAVFMDENNFKYYTKGSFQSGTGLFYHDLFLQTNDPRYIEQGLRPIADTYIRDFINEDGSITVERAVFSNKPQVRTGDKSVEGDMHRYNDDFGNPMLMAASDIFKDEKYRDYARKFALWLASVQLEDGNFFNGKKTISSAVAQSLMYFDELGRYYNDPVLFAAAEKTFKKALDMQLLDTDDPKLYGAFEGMADSDCSDPRKLTQMRTNAYMVIALLKVEGKIRNFWLGGEHNDSFTDPLLNMFDTPYKFKW